MGIREENKPTTAMRATATRSSFSVIVPTAIDEIIAVSDIGILAYTASASRDAN